MNPSHEARNERQPKDEKEERLNYLALTAAQAAHGAASPSLSTSSAASKTVNTKNSSLLDLTLPSSQSENVLSQDVPATGYKLGSYAPLLDSAKEIRLVVLYSALSHSQEIYCELKTVDIANAKYEALSYAWGDDTAKVPILLGAKRFLITENLEHALRNLRYISDNLLSCRILWIDAICIDQGNHVERSQQVRRMGSIYKSAERVLIWLGRYYEPEDDLLHFNKRVWGFKRQTRGNSQSTKAAFVLARVLSQGSSISRRNSDKRTERPSPKPTLNLHTWGFLSIICQRSWFHRLWVIQEINMARKAIVCCGQYQLKWRVLEGAADRVAAYFESPHEWPFSERLHSIDDMTCFAGSISIVGLWDVDKDNILSILVHTQYSKSTDARDRLFALKGLLSKEDTDIEVAYDETAEIVYSKWALRRIKRTRSLDVLTLCIDCKGDNGEKSIASWVPDLRNLSVVDDTFFTLANTISHEQEQPYSAAASTRWEDQTIGKHIVDRLAQIGFAAERVLPVQGVLVGSIAKRISIEDAPRRVDSATDQLMHYVTYLEEQIIVSSNLDPKKSINWYPNTYRAFLDAIFKGWKWYVSSPTAPTLAQRYAVWRGHTSIPADFETGTNPQARLRGYLGNMEMILRLMLKTSDLFITDNGSIGSIPKHCGAGIGDEIFVLLGGNTPFILEIVSGQVWKSVYRLRSSCFLSGYMQGEAIASWEKGDSELETVYVV